MAHSWRLVYTYQMRLLTWNARRGAFTRKTPLLERFSADVVVIPEIAAPSVESDQVLWFGENRKQGLAVVARWPYKLTKLPEWPNSPKYVVPIRVEGPRSFTLFAVWTLGQKEMPYVEAACTAIDLYAGTFASSPVVMMGDFNSNAIWDKQHRSTLNHTAMVERLETYGLVSAYHHHRRIRHGLEPKVDHTFYLYGHEDKSYHIDYCFLPKAWAAEVEEVAIGNYPDWSDHSDHRPLLVTMRSAA